MPSALPLTTEQRDALIAKALQAREGSYSPYSKFRVGACLLADDGEFISGANVECASYGGTICAERTAIVKGVSEGRRRFIGLAVTSDLNGPCPPCGICRQMPILLVPSGYSQATQVLSTQEAVGSEAKDVLVATSMEELLPLSFGPEDLDRPRV